jgi:hypothetical protein
MIPQTKLLTNPVEVYIEPKLSDCRGCRSYKEDAVPLLSGRSSKSEDRIVNYAVWHLTP